MITADVKEYLLDFQKKEIPELVTRDVRLDETQKIKSVIGPRRAGKTYLLYQTIKLLLASGIKKENIVYLNFEDPRLVDVTFKEIRSIIKLHWQLFPASTKGRFYIFIDEPQTIKNWETATRALHDEGYYIFITGSSSKLLSKEIATSLRGRTISYTLLPFSFKEFLKLKNTKFDVQRLSSKEKSTLLNLLDEYLDFGGFPEINKETNAETKVRIITDYFNSIVYKDIVERYKIENTQLIKWLIKILITSFSKEYSIHKIYLTLKSQSIKVSKNTLYAYSAMLQDAMLIFTVPKFDYSIRKSELTINKVYLCDIGFVKLVETSKEIGQKIENAVFLELERRKKPLTDISYWKNQQQEEVDFVIKTGTRVEQLIQVCNNVINIDTKKRELRALIKASKDLRCKNLVVITYDYENTQQMEGRKIKFVPLWKWLLR